MTLSFKDPDTYHHERQMAKAIYTIKIALLQKQLLQNRVKSDQLENISSIGMFLCIFYVRVWLTCTSALDAPANDLLLLKSLLQ